MQNKISCYIDLRILNIDLSIMIIPEAENKFHLKEHI